MSTHIDTKVNKCYSIEATRHAGSKDVGLMVMLSISDGEQWTCIALPKRDAIDFCAKIIQSLNELGESR